MSMDQSPPSWFANIGASLLLTALPLLSSPAEAQGLPQKPNIVFIMGDDVGWFNIGVYHQGIMAGKTPNSSPAIFRLFLHFPE